MTFQKSMTCTNPIGGAKFDVSILSDPARVRDGEDLAADVYLAVYSPVSVNFRMTPADARNLAAHLALAAVAADAGEAEIIDFRLLEAA